MANERAIVVGAGGISGAWFPPLDSESVNVVAVVDLRPDAAQAAIDKYQLPIAKPYADLAQALREQPAEFAVDLTIPAAHADVTCACLDAGLHVIGEKPMADSIPSARRMLAASQRSGKLYMVSQSRRWDIHTDTITRTIASGALGQLTTLNCDFYIGAHFGGFRDAMASPLILDMAIHHFDLARMFSRRNAVSVYAEEFNPAGSWYQGDVAANCIFTLDDNIRFAYRGSWCAEGCATGWNGDWRAIGDNGTLLYTSDNTLRGQIVAGNEGFIRPTADLTPVQSDLEHTGMRGSLREMLAFLRIGQKPQTECHENFNSLAMVFAAIESSRTRARVNLSDL